VKEGVVPKEAQTKNFQSKMGPVITLHKTAVAGRGTVSALGAGGVAGCNIPCRATATARDKEDREIMA